MLSRNEVLGRLRAVVAAFNSHDPAACASLYAAGGALAFLDGIMVEGRPAVEAYFRDWFTAVPDISLEVMSVMSPEPRTVVTEYTIKGTNTGPLRIAPGQEIAPTGRPFLLQAAAIITLNEAGEIQRHQIARDNAALLAQLGLLGAPGIAAGDVRGALERQVLAFNRHDVPALIAGFAEDALFTLPFTQVRGRAAIQQLHEQLFIAYPDVQLRPEEILVEGNRATAIWTLRGTNTGPGAWGPPTGKAVEVQGITVCEVNPAGQLAWQRLYFDGLAEPRQLGLVPPA